MTPQLEPAWISVKDAARLACVSERTIWRQIGAGHIPSKKMLGDIVRIKHLDFLTLLDRMPSVLQDRELPRRGRGRPPKLASHPNDPRNSGGKP